jgi:choline dehydrogenase
MRGQAEDYNNWSKLVKDNSWKWNSILPHFLKHENHYGGII